MIRYVILAINSFDYILSKTGNMLIRYQNESVVAIVDPINENKTAEHVLGWGGQIPVVRNVQNSLQYKPTHLIIGNAPQGGILDDLNRNEIIFGIKNRLNITSGMHYFLSKDKEILKLSKKYMIELKDLRKPRKNLSFSKQLWKKRKIPIMLIVGSDCDTGKMTTAWEITKALKDRNKKVEFLGTGQTGILLAEKGVPVDSIISDYIPGEIEHAINKFDYDLDLLVIEGQGALNNALYSGVTLGLIHGSMPDFLVMTHEPKRKYDVAGNKIPPLSNLIKLHYDLLELFKKSKFLGVNLLTLKISKSEAISTFKKLESELKLPVNDIVRFNGSNIIDKICNELEMWN